MVKIRLSRIGAKGQPYYRVVVVDSRRKRDGSVLETIGHYNPRTEPSSFDIQKDRLVYWRSVGAQLTEPILVLLGETEPKKHRPKNIVAQEVVPTPAPAEGAAEVSTNAPEIIEPAPALADVIEHSDQASPEATPEVIEETVEKTTGTAGEVPAEEDQPTTQEEPVAKAEVAQEEDNSEEDATA